jgi:diguanylate cyclase (GGDEF)-like protein/PAS domain S-box-containing protein
MRSLPIRARAYILSIVLVASVLLGGFGELPRGNELAVFLGLTAATLLTSMLKLRLPTTKGHATMSVSFVIDFAALLLLGPHKAMLIGGIGAISQSTMRVVHCTPVHRIVFNVASVVTTIEAAGVVYRISGGAFAPFLWSTDATPAVLAVTAFFLANSWLLAGAMALSTQRPVSGVWRENFVGGGPSYFVGAAISVLVAEMGARHLWDLLPLITVPVFVFCRAYSASAGYLEEEQPHREVIESLNEGMAVVQSDGRIVLWNDALERMLGVPRHRAIGQTLVAAAPQLESTMVPRVVQAVLETGQTGNIEHLAIQRDGARRILQVRIFVFLNGVTMFWNDITDRAEAETALKHSEERYALAAAGSNDGLWDWDLERAEIYCSPRWKEMLGLGATETFDRPDQWFERVHPEDRAALRSALDAHIRGETPHFQHEHRVRHTDGNYRRVLCRGAAVRRPDGQATRIAGSQTDVTERAAVQEQLRRAAFHDPLTGLPNRLLFLELLGQVLDRSERHPEHVFAVLFLDIDRFKVINDSLGHLIGDELLVAVSRRLEAGMREGDVIARLGGDEFTILLNDLDEPAQASAVASRVLAALRDPFSIKGREVFVSASIGIALSVGRYRQAEHIMRDADTAMYRAKALGKARYVIFDESMHALAVDRLRLESDLRRAIERGEFALHYQPIVALKSGEWTAFEALLRWQRGGVQVSPTEFIPIIEELGLIDVLGDWVIREACRQMADWRARFPHGALGVTVNVSARQLSQPDFLIGVRNAIRDANLQPGDLRIEITETTLMENPEAAETVLRRLRAMGVKVYLDDFGTGFSSLSYLHRFPVDTLKIDQSFIARLSTGVHEPAFIESIVALARTLGTRVVAEGVETEAQMRTLIRLGCGEAQGFFFAHALPPAVAETFLAQTDAAARFELKPRDTPLPLIVH